MVMRSKFHSSLHLPLMPLMDKGRQKIGSKNSQLLILEVTQRNLQELDAAIDCGLKTECPPQLDGNQIVLGNDAYVWICHDAVPASVPHNE